jgi:hypothetical membrane protein
MDRRRWLLLCGPVAAVQTVGVSMADGVTRPGYDLARNWVSQLALGDRGWLGALNLALCGVWLVLFAAGLSAHSPQTAVAARVVALCGLGFGLIAAVPIDAGLGFPPGEPATHTAVGAVHQAGALAVFAGGTVAAAMLGRAIGRYRTGVAVAVLMMVSFVAAAVLVTLDQTGVAVGAPGGLLERVALYGGLGWIGFAGLVVYRRENRPLQRQ